MKATNIVKENDFYTELMATAKHDDAGSRLKAASMIMKKCGDHEVSEVLSQLSAQMDFNDNEEASAAIDRTQAKLDALIVDRRSHLYQNYIRHVRDAEILELSNGEVTCEAYDYLTSSYCKFGSFDPDIFGGSGKIPYYDDKNDKYPIKKYGYGIGHIQCPIHVVLESDYKVIASLLSFNLTAEDIKVVAKYAAYLVLDPGDSSCEKFSILTEKEYQEYKGSNIKVGIGGDAIYEALKSLNYGDEPERLAFSVVPVISPASRPLAYSLADSTFYSFPMNHAYDSVIIRSNRCRKLMNTGAPDIIIHNECMMLDDAVNALVNEAENTVRQTHWKKSSYLNFVYAQMELLRRHRNFVFSQLLSTESNKTSDIESLNIFPKTIQLCNGTEKTEITLTEVINHNNAVISDYAQNNYTVLPGDTSDIDAEAKQEIKELDDTLSMLWSLGDSIISAAKEQRESCKILYDEKEDLYKLIST